jgi:excisionase family DNA binding protein
MSGERPRVVEAAGRTLDAGSTEDHLPRRQARNDRRSTHDLDLPSAAGRFSELALLTPDQLCSLLQVKKSWLYDQVERGALPCLRLGRQLRFRQSDVRRYLDDLYRPTGS